MTDQMLHSVYCIQPQAWEKIRRVAPIAQGSEASRTNSQGNKHILALIDGFTKFCWLYPAKTLSLKKSHHKTRRSEGHIWQLDRVRVGVSNFFLGQSLGRD